MKSSQTSILETVNKMIVDGQGLSLLQKMGMEIPINNWNELDNYLFILLILTEQPSYYAEASGLLLKKVLLNIEHYPFLNGNKERVYDELFNNRVLPYTGLSELIRRLLGTSIRKRENEIDILSKIPDRVYLLRFNINLLKDFLLTQRDLNYATTLLYNCWNDVLSDDKIILSTEATEIYRQYLNDNIFMFDEYLRFFIRFQWYGGSRKWHEGKLIVPEPFFEQIFGSKSKFVDNLLEAKKNKGRYLSDDVSKLYDEIEKYMHYYEKGKNIEYDDPKLNLNIGHHINLYKELNRNQQIG